MKLKKIGQGIVGCFGLSLVAIVALVVLGTIFEDSPQATSPGKVTAASSRPQAMAKAVSAKPDYLNAVVAALEPCEAATKAMTDEAALVSKGEATPVSVYRSAIRVRGGCYEGRASMMGLDVPSDVRDSCIDVTVTGTTYAEAAMAALDQESVGTVAGLEEAAGAYTTAKLMCAARAAIPAAD